MSTDTKTSLSGSRFRPDDQEWHVALYEAAAEVFELMVGEPVSRQEASAVDETNNTTAMVGLAGALCGVLSIRCHKVSAASIASKMLGEPVQSTDSTQLCDAVGEICNMVAGNFKARIEGLQEKCMLSVPTVITGQDYSLHSLADDDRLEVVLGFQGETIVLRLEVHG